MNKEEKAYIEYLNELYEAPDYGLLLFKGDPLAFQIGLREWLSTLSNIDKNNLGLTPDTEEEEM